MAINVKFMPKKEVMDKLSKLYPDFRPYYVEAIQELFGLSNELEKALELYYARYGFTRARYLILMVLLHSDDKRLQPCDIADSLNVTRGNMTGLVDALLKSGFVKKYSDKEDRRQCWIELTEKGEKFLEKIFPSNFRRIAKFMSVITKAEIESLIQISKKLHGALDAFKEDEPTK
jgi:DNA-binding MarR family transcriptional regulator